MNVYKSVQNSYNYGTIDNTFLSEHFGYFQHIVIQQNAIKVTNKENPHSFLKSLVPYYITYINQDRYTINLSINICKCILFSLFLTRIKLFLVAKKKCNICTNVNFSDAFYDRGMIFLMKIYLMNEHLFNKYFVRISVGQDILC